MLNKDDKTIRIFTRGEAIRRMCLDCCCFKPQEVVHCVAYDCPLWPYSLSSHARSMKYTPEDFRVEDCRVRSTNLTTESEFEVS